MEVKYNVDEYTNMLSELAANVSLLNVVKEEIGIGSNESAIVQGYKDVLDDIFFMMKTYKWMMEHTLQALQDAEMVLEEADSLTAQSITNMT